MDLFKKYKNKILENAFSYVVVLAMLIYGFGKIVQFNGAASTPLRVSEMTGMQLMWAFYGYSKPFVYTIGALEVIGGILLFFNRTRIIGCLFVSTILINIILQDIFYEVNKGALRAAIFYQVLIVQILYFNRSKLVATWKLLTQKVDKPHSLKESLLVFLFPQCCLFLYELLNIILPQNGKTVVPTPSMRGQTHLLFALN